MFRAMLRMTVLLTMAALAPAMAADGDATAAAPAVPDAASPAASAASPALAAVPAAAADASAAAPAAIEATGPTSEAAATALVARLKTASEALTTISMPFVQTKQLAIMDEPLVTPGVIEISRPKEGVRWQFTGKSTVIFYKGRVRRWGADGKEEAGGSKDPSMQSLQDQMRAFLSGDWNSLRTLFTLTAPDDGRALLVLTPKSKDLARFIDHIDLRFRDDCSAPRMLHLVAGGGDETSYAFGTPTMGLDLPLTRFTGP
jgi:hypothetical protein